jgi:O-antigen/teichoic acid export membrane protein
MILGGSLGFVFIILVSFFLFQDDIFQFLASGKNIKIEVNFILLVFIIFIVKVFANVFASVLQAMGKFENMFNYVVVQAIVALVLQVMLGWLYGAYGVLFAIFISYLITAVWYLPRKVIEYI